MPKYDPLAQQIVAVLQFHTDEEEQKRLQEWLNEYGQRLSAKNSYDLYLRLSHSMLRKFSKQITHERQQALIDAYETCITNPTAGNKNELRKQRNRLENTAWKLGNIPISNGLLHLSQVLYSKSFVTLAAEHIMSATECDSKTQSIITANRFDNKTKATPKEWNERVRLHSEQVKNAASPKRIKLLYFCLREYQRILTDPIAH
jgi:hypothetical protein